LEKGDFAMKKKQKMILGFVILIMAIFTLNGCVSLADMFKAPEFPEEFRGTWKREGINNTLTITARTYTLSHQQPDYWILDRVSGDTYHVSINTDRSWRGIERIRLINGNLVIDPDACNGTGLDQCGGTWIRQ
jgi:hypothetical protein